MNSKKKYLLTFTFFSGFAALLYELVWFRELHLLFGVSSTALAIVVSTFFLGLVIGSYFGGKYIDTCPSLRTIAKRYAFVEIAIALSAFLVLFLLHAVQPILSFFYQADLSFFSFTLVRFLLSILVLIVPTTFIGATFPIIVTLYTEKRSEIKESISLLYFINTLGGVLGVIVAGFFLIRLFGTSTTMYIAVSLNVIVSVLALRISKKYATSINDPDEGVLFTKNQKKISILLLLFFFSGFTALAYEVVWSRLLVLYSFGTIYATSILLALFLLGIALGSFTYSRFFKKNALSYFVYLELCIALLSLIGLWLFSNYPEQLFEGFGTNLMTIIGLSSILVLLPSFCFGVIFPLVADYILQRSPRIGSKTGFIYAINTLGSIIGALVAGFILIPYLGLVTSLIVLSFASFSIAFATLFLLPKAKKLLSLFGVCLVILLLLSFSIPQTFFLGTFQPSISVVYSQPGYSAAVTVLEDASEEGIYHRLFVDNQEVAADTPVLALDSKILAHLPLLLHEGPKNALTVGFGTGGTSYSMLRHDIERVDAVEIEQQVVDASTYFTTLNEGIFTDDRFEIIIEDARSHLLHTDRTYDVISTDVTNLRYNNNHNLYTKEYFELLKERINDNGIVAAWIPVSDVSEKEQKILMNTFQEVFPEMSVWYMYNKLSHFFVYIGSDQPLSINYTLFSQRFNQPNVVGDLSVVGITEYNLLNGLFLDSTAVEEYLSDTDELHTDSFPILAFPDFVIDEQSFTFGQNMIAIYSRKIDPLVYITGFSSEEQAQFFLEEFKYEQEAVGFNLILGHAAFVSGNHQQAALFYATAIENADYLDFIDVV